MNFEQAGALRERLADSRWLVAGGGGGCYNVEHPCGATIHAARYTNDSDDDRINYHVCLYFKSITNYEDVIDEAYETTTVSTVQSRGPHFNPEDAMREFRKNYLAYIEFMQRPWVWTEAMTVTEEEEAERMKRMTAPARCSEMEILPDMEELSMPNGLHEKMVAKVQQEIQTQEKVFPGMDETWIFSEGTVHGHHIFVLQSMNGMTVIAKAVPTNRMLLTDPPIPVKRYAYYAKIGMVALFGWLRGGSTFKWVSTTERAMQDAVTRRTEELDKQVAQLKGVAFSLPSKSEEEIRAKIFPDLDESWVCSNEFVGPWTFYIAEYDDMTIIAEVRRECREMAHKGRGAYQYYAARGVENVQKLLRGPTRLT